MSLLLYFLVSLVQNAFSFPIEARGNVTAVNGTKTADPSWSSTPDVRGTFDLVLGCLTTLSLCAWTAYHPNVHPEYSQLRYYRLRIGWMLVAVFVPEIVVFCAWEQRWAVKKLKEEINEERTGGDEKGKEKRVGSTFSVQAQKGECTVCDRSEHDEERSGGGQVEEDVPSSEEGSTQEVLSRNGSAENEDVMTGTNESTPNGQPSSDGAEEEHGATSANESAQAVQSTLDNAQEDNGEMTDETAVDAAAVSSDQEKGQELPTWTTEQAFFALSGGFAVNSSSFWHQSQLTFTPAGLTVLAKAGLHPAVTQESVEDKSKADTVAKALVLIQAGWFFVQSIARLVQKLPLTLLELHILAHVLCAFCMYFLWLRKPYDVGSPVVCEDERIIDMAALFALGLSKAPKIKNLYWYTSMPYPTECCQKSSISLSLVQAIHFAPYLPKYFGFKRMFSDDRPDRTVPRYQKHPQFTVVSEREQEQFDRANRALARLKTLGLHFRWQEQTKPYCLSSDSPHQEEHVKEIACLRFENALIVPCRSNLQIDGLTFFMEFDDDNLKRARLRTRQGRILVLFSALYGGLHLAVWNTHFASRVEMWMWRGSGVAMTATPITWAGTTSLSALQDALRPWKERKGILQLISEVVDGVAEGALIVVLILFGFAAAAYPFARLYVLVESFVGLRSPPIGTYKTVSWTNFLPHVG